MHFIEINFLARDLCEIIILAVNSYNFYFSLFYSRDTTYQKYIMSDRCHVLEVQKIKSTPSVVLIHFTFCLSNEFISSL